MRFAILVFMAALTLGCASSESSRQQTPYTEVGTIEDASIAGARRVSARIVIPLGRSREDVRATLERAAVEIAQREQADATLIFAYRPQDVPTGRYTVGRATYAPNGRWEDAGRAGAKATTVDLGDLYFAVADSSASDPPLGRGDSVVLMPTLGEAVVVSRSADKWTDEDVLLRAASGTRAVVVERRAFPVSPDVELIRYRVRLIDERAGADGWVQASDVRRP